jgi:hypothetical protein
VINPVLYILAGSSLELSNIAVIFCVHGDSVWSTLPPGTSSVGLEHQFVEYIMLFTFTEPKIVIKSMISVNGVNFKKSKKSFLLLLRRSKNDFFDFL